MVVHIDLALYVVTTVSLLPCALQLWLFVVAPVLPNQTYWIIRLPYRATAGIREAAQLDPVVRSTRIAALF